MLEIIIGVGLVFVAGFIIIALIALGPITLGVGFVAFFVSCFYMVGYGATHSAHPPDASWPLIGMIAGFFLMILGGVGDER